MTGLWYRALWEEERALAGADPYVWGLRGAGRKSIKCSIMRCGMGWSRESLGPRICFIQVRWRLRRGMFELFKSFKTFDCTARRGRDGF
jgi:hypothetical protein